MVTPHLLHQTTPQLIALLNGVDERAQGLEADLSLPVVYPWASYLTVLNLITSSLKGNEMIINLISEGCYDN